MQHQTNSQNNLTFLKSNYKYKRRDTLTMRALPVCGGIVETRKPNQLAATLPKSNTSAVAKATATATATTACKCSTILSLFIVITWRILQASSNCLGYAVRIIANVNGAAAKARPTAYAGHDVSAATKSHPHPHPRALPHSHLRTKHDDNDANDKVSTAREQQKQQQQQQQQQQQHFSSSSPQKSKRCTTAATATTAATTATSAAAKSRLPLMTLLIALLMGMRLVSAGTCWQTHLGSGKCNHIFSTNITKSSCCGASQSFSYTDRELSSVEHFFATAIGGGVECAPCVESCKDFKCGPNMKCVKRKGRPKCVCAPECGATLRRKQQQQQQQQHHSATQQWEQSSATSSSSSSLSSSSMPPRGSRSLSSEITNTNLGLNGAKRPHKQSDSNNGTDNQRTQEQIQQRTELAIPKQPSHRRRQGAQGEMKHRRLLIIDNSNLQEQPTTRRLQMQGNSNRHTSSNSNSSNNNNNHSKGGRVQMQLKVKMESSTQTAGYERRRHRKNKTNNSNNNDKHLTRSMTTLTTTTTGANDSSTTPAQTSQSRQKLANANEPANDHIRQSQDNAATRVRHQHQQHAPNHEQTKFDNGTQQQQQRRRKHKHKDQHRAAANTTMSGAWFGSGSGTHGHHRLYLAEHGSEKAASSASSNSRHSHGHLANVDDLAFLAEIYEPASSQPVQQHQQHQQHTNPVCGTDGRTYNTECQLLKRACRTKNAQLEVAYRGHCKTSCNGVQCLNGLTCVEDQYMAPHCITCNIQCPWDDNGAYDLDGDGLPDEALIDEERAVCGVDGKTYKSTCDINRMVCKIGRSIAVAYPGPCREDHATCADIKCGPKDTCLVDLLTHMPRCVSCRYKCPRKHHRTQLRSDKICGNNNHTYNSWCEMRKDSCATGYFVGVRSAGVC